METWNERFAAALASSGLSLAELSKRADISHVAPLRWMGTPSMAPATDVYASTLLRACRVLGVRIEWVLDGELPERTDQQWPFTVSRERLEHLSVLHRVLIDRLVADVVEILSDPGQENSS